MCPLVLILLAGCGVKDVPRLADYDDKQCWQLWAESEKSIHQQQVADSATVRVRGFPYLRSTRYLQALADRAVGAEERQYVLEQMRLLDLDKRLLELSRIPGHSLAALSNDTAGPPLSLRPRLNSCSSHFLQADGRKPGFFEEVRQGMDLDQDYSLWLRTVGLYPLTSLVVGYVADKAQAEMVARLSAAALPETGEEFLTFRPAASAPRSWPDLPELLGRSRNNPLHSLELAEQDLLALAQKFAPLLTIADGASQDRFGRIVRQQGVFVVDGNEPVVYYYFSQTFVQDIPALQINYALWFSERTAPAPWFEHGTLDGLNVRVTLNWQGHPIFVDVSFQCGCNHFVLFNARFVSGTLREPQGFLPYVGGTFPELKERERLQFRINSGWHQIGHVGAALASAQQPTYQLLPYEGLEYFEQDNEVSSLFNGDGRVAGSNRPERFFLFPMGIPKVGAMRQRGRQPITLIGRAYLDDPYLFDHAFSYLLPRPAIAVLPSPACGAQKESGGTETTNTSRTSPEKTGTGE